MVTGFALREVRPGRGLCAVVLAGGRSGVCLFRAEIASASWLALARRRRVHPIMAYSAGVWFTAAK